MEFYICDRPLCECLCYISIRFGACVCLAVDTFLFLLLDFISLYNIEAESGRERGRERRKPIGIIAKRLTRLFLCAHVAIICSFVLFPMLVAEFPMRVVYDGMFSYPAAEAKIFCFPFFNILFTVTHPVSVVTYPFSHKIHVTPFYTHTFSKDAASISLQNYVDYALS